MTIARSQKKSTNDSVHTKESILAKLDTDLTDSERKSYFKILLQSPETSHLLTIVALKWKKNLLEKQITMEKLKNSILIKNCYIDVQKKSDTFDRHKNIELMQKSLDDDNLALKDVQSVYEVSAVHAEKSLILFSPALDELKENIDEMWRINLHK